MTATVDFGGKVPAEEYDRFKEIFPQYGATKWFINVALKSFNDYVDRNPIVREAVDRSINEMLDETLKTTT